MNRVTIRTKKKNKGTMLSVFLEYNPIFVNPKGEEVRYEFLNLEKYVNPMAATTSASDGQPRFSSISNVIWGFFRIFAP